MCERSELGKGLLAITLPGWSVAVSKGIGSKIGVVRPDAYEVNAVLCAKGVQVDGYLSVAHFTTCTTVQNGGGRHLRMGGGQLFVCVRKGKFCKLDALRVLLRPPPSPRFHRLWTTGRDQRTHAIAYVSSGCDHIITRRTPNFAL